MADINTLFQRAQQAIAFIEDADARKILKEFRDFLASQNLQQTNPSLHRQMQKLMIQLQIVAFSILPDEESEDVLRRHYLESFEIEVPMKTRIEPKLFMVPYLVRDELRKKLQKALLENTQRIGPLTIGQWIREFEKNFDAKTRAGSAVVQFVATYPGALKLSGIERKMLKDVLFVYDYYLVSTLPATGWDLYAFLEGTDQQSPSDLPGSGSRGGAVSEIKRSGIRPMQPGAPNPQVQMTLQEALKKFEKLGEQLVSNNPIKLKIFASPVRPSIKNWIADYYEKVEARRHDSIERGNYLFHSENARRLTTGERQKVGTMLRALDEETLVTVDPGRQEVFFQSENSELETSRIQKAQDTDAFRNTKAPLPTLSPLRRGEEEAAGGMNFSSPHKFPTERSVVRSGSFPQSGQQPRAGKNVVDLREQ